jgi:glycosyltransferase involved in cell wall biosynthesis
VVAHLSDALADRGHDVTLFASADSCTRAKLHPTRDVALRLDPEPGDDVAAHLNLLEEVRDLADRFDILHFHTGFVHFPMFAAHAPRTLTTVHGRLDIPDLEPLLRRHPRYPLVSISEAQRAPLPDASWAGTVYHGYPADQFQTGEGGDHLVFLGRMSPEKRPDRAIRIALAAGRRIKLAAKVDPVDRAWFEREVAPLLEDPRVEHVGEIGEAEKSAFLGSAAGLLFPIDWPEPFGLVMIEALGCGTPVIGFDRGSVPEVITHGQNGFIVRTEAEAVEAVRRLDRIDRRAVRRSFERRFTVDAMAGRYLEVYERVLARGPRPSRPPLRAVPREAGLRAS